MRVLIALMIGGALWAQAPAAPGPTQGAPAASGAADPVVMTVGAAKITRSGFELIFKNLPDSVRAQLGGDGPEAKRRFAEEFGAVIGYANEARKLKIDSGAAYRAQVFFQDESLLAGLLYQHALATNKPADEASKAWFDAHKEDYQQARIRQIVIRFQGSRAPLKSGQADLSEEAALAKAKVLRQRIVGGEDFGAIAKAESDDAASAANGGDLSAVGHGRLLPELDKAAFALSPGAISEPVKTQYGWHLIQVQDVRTQSFDEVKADIEKALQTENAQKAMQAISASNKVVLDDTYFMGASPAPPVPAAK
jgi:peptidyl-prolyl cis-trans isomerase C